MTTYNPDIIVSNAEIASLKEVIFQRVRDRAEALEEQTKTSYTSAIKTDVMNIARDSFISTSKNPFRSMIENSGTELQTTISNDVKIVEQNDKKEVEETNIVSATEFLEQKSNELKAQILAKNKTIEKDIAQNTIADTMSEARNNFINKSSFMGALNFLNAQATISLISKENNSFNAVV